MDVLVGNQQTWIQGVQMTKNDYVLAENGKAIPLIHILSFVAE